MSKQPEDYSIDGSDSLPIIINTIMCSFSLLGSSFIMFMFCFFPHLRTFAFKLVFFLTLSDFFLSGFSLLVTGTNTLDHENSRCITQAFFINMFSLSSICWTTVIAYTIYRTVMFSKKEIVQYRWWKFNLYAFGLPFLFSLIPFFSDDYGVAGNWSCWIKQRPDQKKRGLFLRLLEFYFPLWIAIIFNLFTLWKVIKYLRKMMTNTKEAKFIKKLQLYPIILVVCWFWGTVNRFYMFSGKEKLWLNVLHVFFGSMQGFLNALVYGFTDSVKQAVSQQLCGMLPCCYKRELDENEDKEDEINFENVEFSKEKGLENDDKFKI